ncbi:MAG: fasciclin domain-containing protein [bacterium]
MNDSMGMMVGGAMMLPSKNIVENAMMANNVTTLVAAVKAAGLAETLSGAGPFTVFAPTNDAFAKLPAGTVETLLMPENKERLVGILTYHVVPGSWMAGSLAEGEQKVKTVNGKELTITKKGGTVWVNEAMVEMADIVSSNGVTHLIDTVLMP